MTPPKAVLFDLGNVLVSIHSGAFTAYLDIDPAMAKKKYQESIIASMRRYEAGDATTDEYLNQLSDLFKGRYTKEQLTEAMLRVIGEPIAEMDSIVGNVASTTPVALVSNTNELHFSFCRKRIPALRHFHQFFLSYEMKASKPDPPYYKRVLEKLQISPNLVMFIDDLEENVGGAEDAGMKGILFTAPEKLQKTLNDFGVL